MVCFFFPLFSFFFLLQPMRYLIYVQQEIRYINIFVFNIYFSLLRSHFYIAYNVPEKEYNYSRSFSPCIYLANLFSIDIFVELYTKNIVFCSRKFVAVIVAIEVLRTISQDFVHILSVEKAETITVSIKIKKYNVKRNEFNDEDNLCKLIIL